MAEHTYKKGDVVALRFTIAGRVNDEARRLAGGREWALLDAEGHYVPWVRTEDLTPFLAVEDQDALLRVVKAARAVVNSGHSPRCVEQRAHIIVNAGQGSPLPCICRYAEVYHDLYKAVNGGLPESIRARLSEGE